MTRPRSGNRGYAGHVRVAVKLFAALREQRGAREVELELEDGSRVDAVWPALGLSDEPLSLERVVAEVASDDAGAIATFVGTTRAQSRGREVVRLEYEAYAGM